jgi:hypothetical protein
MQFHVDEVFREKKVVAVDQQQLLKKNEKPNHSLLRCRLHGNRSGC